MIEENPIVTVKQGQLRGKTAIDHEGNKFYCFQGIPYAKPPLGDLRFKAPQPAEPWSGVRQATEEGNSCYAFQMKLQRIAGSEDCLFLNVYTPQLPTSGTANVKPVMVWIHGGAFASGSGSIDSYGPDFLISEDVVVVLINYRYGLLGFMSFQDPSLGIPGNSGLKDQVLALQWVKDNIKAFNGDPDNVTVFGESSGGASVHYLMLSPMTTGLFTKVIVQSGSALCCWARGQHSAPHISTALGLETLNESELVKLLKEMPVEKLYELQKILPDAMSPSMQRPFGPVVEVPSDEPGFLLKEPLDIIKSGSFNKVPMIIGYTSREGMMAVMLKRKGEEVHIDKNVEATIPYTLNIKKGTELYKGITNKVKDFYFGEEEPSLRNIDQYYMLLTDTLMLHAINEATKQHGTTNSAPVYYYRVSVESKLNKYKVLAGIRDTGVCHADDLGYLFKTPSTPKIRPNSIEDWGMKRFVKLWTNFAKYGDPNPSQKDPLINVKWNPISKNELHYLDIGENLTLGINPDSARMAFWTEIDALAKQA